MRIAVVLTALHRRTSLQACPMDTERLLEWLPEHRLAVFVDQATEGSEAVRLAGVPVSVALKRSVISARSERESSDALQARAAHRWHQESAFDVIVYGSDVTVDYAWFEPALRAVPRGVCLGAGPAHDLRAVWQDRYLFSRLARRSWSLSGLVSSADFLLSDVVPEAFGLKDEGLLPPRLVLSEDLPQPTEASPEHRWVAVVATSLGGHDLEGLMPRIVRLWPAEDSVTYLVITRPAGAVGRAPDVLLLATCSEALRRQTIVVSTGDDGVAADFLRAVDIVVVASMAELATPGVAEMARDKGWVLLDPPSTATQEMEKFPCRVPSARKTCDVQVLSWQEPPSRLAATLADLAPDLGVDDFLMIHVGGRAGPAVGLFELAGLDRVDVVVWGQPDQILGSPDPQRLYPFAFAVRGAGVGVVASAVSQAHSIWDLICWTVSCEWIDRQRLLVLPAPVGTECWEVGDIDHIDAVWSLRSGVLPVPRWLLTVAAPAAPAPALPQATHPPRRLVSQVPSRSRISLAAWARRTTWVQRLRLALPWKWGFLERAMKDQW